jgi:hypothetical protein
MAVAQSFAAEMGREMRASAGVLDCRFTMKSAHNRGRSLRFAVSAISRARLIGADAAAMQLTAVAVAGLVTWHGVRPNQPRLPVVPCRYRGCSAR